MGSESFETAFERVKILVQEYESNHNFYLSPDYNESQARKDFIDKLFTTLGWDVNHEIQKNPYEQEVKVERPVATGQSQRSADYAFYIAPNFRDPLLFVEAKKPSKDLAAAINCFQTVRYGWNASMPVAVLTNFEQFIVLDSRYKPDIDTAVNQICQKYHYSEYSNADKFAEIYYLASRDAVAAGSLEKYAETLPRRRGKAIQRGLFKGGWQPVDESFLEELDVYRDELARNFKNHNPELKGETLTEITQRTIDRLVFLRFLEDKIIEPKPYVSEFGDKGNPWHEFIACCHKLDHVYNGIVFKQHDILDSPIFKVDEAQFADLCEELAHVNSPYDFNTIPIYILGSIYERFLGKVIVTTAKRVKVEEKPEVRKAGGVYYTPEYVVRYIVANTIEKLISGKTPAQIAEMRFADTSCGSGSFLVAIYDSLLRYHFAWFNDHPNKAEKDGCVKGDDGHWHLSLKQKRKILLNNVYGVDIDHQAVEVAQMSLYLRLLEEETTASARNYQLEIRETILPPLNKNVVSGNSLIGTDILDGKLFPSEEERKINPMNFEDAFPEVIKRGGFDAIVGNPPWGASFSETELTYFRNKYQRVIARMVDSYIYFLDRALQLVHESGIIGYIVPSTILNQVDAKPIRGLLLSRGVSSLINLGAGVFNRDVLNTSTIIITGTRSDGLTVLEDLSHLPPIDREKALATSNATCSKDWEDLVRQDPHLTFFVNKLDASQLLRKLREKHPLLGNLIIGSIQRGVSPDIAEAHVVTKAMASELKLEAELLRPSISGSQIKRYKDWKIDQLIIYTSRDTPIKKYPHVFEYLKRFQTQNSCPEVKQRKHPWWVLHRPRDPQIFASPKIVGLTTTKTIELIFDPKDSLYVTDAMYVFGLPNNWDVWTLMAIMQSKLFLFLYRTANQGESRVIPQVKASKLSTLPMPACNVLHPQSQLLRNHCDKILEAKKKLAKVQTEEDKTYYENKCAALDRQIDKLVYDLYGLSEDEIKIVERES